MKPILRFLFPEVPDDHPAQKHMAVNMIANVLGLGWAATPAGLRAMEELREFSMDTFFGMDTQKDAIVHSISTVMLDPTGGTAVQHIDNIKEVIINGQELGLGGYLDIGLKDTMKDLIVNFIGAVVFSIIGYFYVDANCS